MAINLIAAVCVLVCFWAELKAEEVPAGLAVRRSGRGAALLAGPPERMPAEICPGERIKVRSGIRTTGTYAVFVALQGGAAGATIEARNKLSGRICSVVVAAPGEAYVKRMGRLAGVR